MGISFDDPSKNLDFATKEEFPFELWTDGPERTLALTYGAASSASAGSAGRISVVLDTDGTWLLTYYPVNVASGAVDALADCQQLFGQ